MKDKINLQKMREKWFNKTKKVDGKPQLVMDEDDWSDMIDDYELAVEKTAKWKDEEWQKHTSELDVVIAELEAERTMLEGKLRERTQKIKNYMRSIV